MLDLFPPLKLILHNLLYPGVYLFALITEEGFLISSCYSLEPHVQGGVAVRGQEGREELLHVQGQEGRW